MDKIDQIRVAKIFPANMQDAVPKAAQMVKAQYRNQMKPGDKTAHDYLAANEAALDQFLETYTFQPELKTTMYGSLEDDHVGNAQFIFAGPNHKNTTANTNSSASNHSLA